MLLWLRNLRIHRFEPRHFENIRLDPTHVKNSLKVHVHQGNIEKEKSSRVNDAIDELEPNAIANSSNKHNLESSCIEEEPTIKKKKALD